MFSEIIIRPPVEANSVLIAVTEGCSWNKCIFCSTYRNGQAFRIREEAEVLGDIEKAKMFYGDATHVFLAGGNALCAPTNMLITILNRLYMTFPSLQHVSLYGKHYDALKKSLDELKALQQAGLNTVYMGLESGSARVLRLMKKGATPRMMIRAGKKIREAGIRLSLYVILGLGGQELTEDHVRGTTEVLNAIDPEFIRFRTLKIMRNAPLIEKIQTGEFQFLAPIDILREQRAIIAALTVHSEIRNDHYSNYDYFEGTIPEDQQAILKLLDIRIKDPKTYLLKPKTLLHI